MVLCVYVDVLYVSYLFANCNDYSSSSDSVFVHVHNKVFLENSVIIISKATQVSKQTGMDNGRILTDWPKCNLSMTFGNFPDFCKIANFHPFIKDEVS